MTKWHVAARSCGVIPAWRRAALNDACVPACIAGDGRYRMPRHGCLDGPLHDLVDPDGRRRNPLDRAAPFTKRKHMLSNLGDGTYNHSGLLAIRQSIAAKVNITYKILFNSVVAMTGGQPIDGGGLGVAAMTRELEAEGIKRIVVVADEPAKYTGVTGLAPGVEVRHRDQRTHRLGRLSKGGCPCRA
jgi:hypothetical protein